MSACAGINIDSPWLDLRQADCMDLMKEYGENHFDLAIVDPPYGINIGANKSGLGRRKGDKKAEYKIGDWDKECPSKFYFQQVLKVAKNSVIWGANHFISKIPIDSSCWIVWDKLFSDAVSFAGVELAWTTFYSTAKKFECSPHQSTRIHPTQKPVQLYKWLLTNYAKPGQRILDTHMGSGSIAIACHYFGAHLTACEIDEDYFRAACQRIERETRQTTFWEGEEF